MSSINLPPQKLTYNQNQADYWQDLIPNSRLSDRDYREKMLRQTSGNLREFMAATTIPRPMEFYQCGRKWDKMQDLQQKKLDLVHSLPEPDRTSKVRINEERWKLLNKMKKRGDFKHLIPKENK